MCNVVKLCQFWDRFETGDDAAGRAMSSWRSQDPYRRIYRWKWQFRTERLVFAKLLPELCVLAFARTTPESLWCAGYAAFTGCNWLATIRPSVSSDWKFSGVISDCGMVKSNSASTPSIQVDHVHRGQADLDETHIRRDIRGERILFEDALHQLDDAIRHIGVERLHLQYPML
jgi:hypothetical protein